MIRTTEYEKRLQKRIKELSILYEISKLLTSSMELDEVLNKIVEITAKTIGVKACGVRLLDQETGEMVLKAVYGLSEEYINKGKIYAWKGVYRDVILKGQVVFVYDVATDPRFEYTEEAIEEGIKSMLSIGLLVNGKPIGALSVYTDKNQYFSKWQIQTFKGIANEAAAVIERAMLYAEHMKATQIEQELSIAAAMQARLMPQELPKIPNFEISAKNIPSRAVGGDFYDFVPIGDNHYAIAVADVSGKGIPGAILMASARASWRAYLEDPHSVSMTMSKMNHVLYRDTEPDQFVTMFYGMLDVDDKTLTYTNAGHNPAILLRNDETLILSEGGLILGAFPNSTYEERVIQLRPGDVLLLYTDGVIEAERQEEYFGLERLIEVLKSSLSQPADEIINQILNAVEQFKEQDYYNDDTTLVCIKYLE